MFRRFLALPGFAFLALPISAQSLYIDFGPADSPHGVPTPNYGGSIGVPGFWNAVSTTSVSGLRRWDGAVTGVGLTISDTSIGCDLHNVGAFGWGEKASTTGQHDALLDDVYNPGGGFETYCYFQGLDLGQYIVDTIIPDQFCGGTGMHVSVMGSADPRKYAAGGPWPGSFIEGQHYTRHAVTVTDGTLTVVLDHLQDITDYTEVSGIQLSMGEQALPGTPMCFGDGSALTCPCANNGREGRGCENSASTGGAVLFATGTANPDTVVLHSSGELASALSIFLQGDASILPTPYGDGVRCTGGALRRLYAKSASAGEASAPSSGDPSITVRSAALGAPIPPAAVRNYQVFYRDPNPNFCSPPLGSTFNVSSAVQIIW